MRDAPTAPAASARPASGSVRLKALSILGHSNFVLSLDELGQAYGEVLEQVASGRITLDFESFSLDEVSAAWAAQAAGGKAVIRL